MPELATPVAALFSPEFLANPYPTYGYLRRTSPVHRVRSPYGFDMWLLTRYGHVKAALATLDLGERGVATAFGLSYLRLDPDQRRLFRLLGLAAGNDLDAYAAAALAKILAYLGRCDEAEDLAGKALQIALAHGNRYVEAVCELAYVVSARRRGDLPATLGHALSLLSLGEETGDLISQLHALMLLADVRRRMGQLEVATGLLEHAEAVGGLIGPMPFAAVFLPLAWGDLLLAQGVHADARTRYEEAIAVAQPAGHRYAHALALRGLAAALSDVDPQRAAGHAGRARRLFTALAVPEARE